MPRSFKLLETLGEGAFGAVHLAEVQGGEGFVQRLAVKWLHPQWSHDSEVVGRLRDEARLLALLNHEHVVRVHGLTRINGRLAILMEAVEGADLSRLADGEIVPPRAAIAIAGAVADALDAAWQTVPPGGECALRVVHRDIKPSNMMVTARGGVKVMDFGVARATFDHREARTRSQQFGTARYMAPERWLESVADAPSDVFSLGVTLIELMGGHPVERPRLAPEGFAEDIDRALAALNPWPDIRELARRMTAYKPVDRPHASEIAATCRALEETLPAPSIREWAAHWVPAHAGHKRPLPSDGSLVNEDVTEGFEHSATAPYESTAALPAALPSSDRQRRPGTTTPLPLPDVTPPPVLVREEPAEAVPPAWRRVVMSAAILVAMTVLVVVGFQYWRKTPEVGPRPQEVVVVREPGPVVDPTPPPAIAPSDPVVPVAASVVAAPVVAEEPPPAPIRKVTPRPPPVVAPVVPPPPTPTVETIPMTFLFDAGVDVRVRGQQLEPNHAVRLPKGPPLSVSVNGRDCTITVDASQSRVHVDPTWTPPCKQ